MATDIFAMLNTAQRKAVDTIDGPVMVIAGPGTGKTQLLALRAANILQKTDTAPQNILCLTYTEVGARNMRERLSSLIGQAAYDIRISTYHGFGSDLIRQYGEYFQQYGADQPVDKIGQISIMHDIYATLQTTNPLWRADVYLKDALQFIGECKKALLSPDDVRSIAEANAAYIASVNPMIKQTVPPFPRMNKDTANYFVALLGTLSAIPTNAPLPDGVVPIGQLLLLDLASAVESFEETGKTNAITTFKTKWLEKNHTNEWVMNGMREVAKLQGGADIYEKYLVQLEAQHLFDYDDMINRAIKALQDNDDLRFSLHEQYLYIMLDEFQDTNRAQLKLIELLSNNPVLEGRPNVLAVGDDDQAIYSFQGAELGNMVAFINMYSNVKIITLTDNYRSHEHILTTAHALASSIEERLSEKLGKDDKRLVSKNDTIPPATIERHQFKSDIAQYDWIASRIDKHILDGTKPNEIAVLAPKHKYLEPLVTYLSDLGVPIRYDKRENILDDSNIAELTTKAELVMALATNDHGKADSLWPSVLSADYWQLPTSLIWQISWINYDNNRLDPGSSTWQRVMIEQGDVLTPIALFFARLAQLQQHETLESMFDYLVGVQPLKLNEADMQEYTAPYYEYYFGSSAQQQSAIDFTHTLSNLTVLRQHLREYRSDSDAPLHLTDMLDFIADYRAAGEKLLNTSPYHSADSAVQLMTAYGAKGLEFETVYIIAAQDEVWGMKDRSPNNIVSLPPNLRYIRRAGSTKDEKKRLFYVALTRAKHSVYITGYDQNYAGRTTQPLEFLNEVDGAALTLPHHSQTIIRNNAEKMPLETLEHFWTARHTNNNQDVTLKELALPRLDAFQLSATHLNTFTDLVYGGPQEFFMNTVLRFPKAPTSDGQFGNAIHETLESLQHALKRTGELPDTEHAIAIFSTKLKAKKLSDAEFERMEGRGAQALRHFLPWWWHNFTPEAHAEYNFRHEGSFVGDAHLTGNLDQLLIDKESKTIRIIDFKTGKPHARWTRDVKSHKYKQQLIFYKLLTENSHSFKGYEVNEAALVFVEPDPVTGTMHELPIVFSQEEIARTKQLVTAVWRCISALDLPDTTQFSADIKGILEFEDWLITNKSM